MRRFRQKGALVMVAALLLLSDFLWTRSVPPLDADPPETPGATAVQYAAAETAVPRPTAAPAVRSATALPIVFRAAAATPAAHPMPPQMPVTARLNAVADALRPNRPAARLPSLPRPSTTPAPREARSPALEEALRPVVTARVAALVTPIPAARFDAVLPPRPWSPPQGIAYIRWWRTA